MNAIETHALSKKYGVKMAVNHFDMQVSQGEIYGFVGRNGAGKSTVMKMISGLIYPTEGEIQVFGHPVGDSDTHQKIGVLIESPGLYPQMSAFDNLMIKALCLGVVDPKEKCNELLEFVGLSQVGKKKSSQFSMGMKQRLGLALALLGDPDLLLLDEPLNGLDPEGVRDMRRIIAQLNGEKGMTVVISSHVLEQLEKMVTRYGVIREGCMVREITAQEVDQECSDYLWLRTANSPFALALLQEKIPEIHCQVVPEDVIKVYGEQGTERVASILAEASVPVQELYVYRRDIEDFFVEMMGDDQHV
jgi:ABC-2 type transport system ATP-binding protein